MSEPNEVQEPLNNVALESAILGLRMALTPEEGVELREQFLTLLRDSHLAVPTAQPAPTGPDGQLLPGHDIQLIVAEDPNGISGVPTFTTLIGLRTALPQVEHGMFLTGAQLGGILAESPLKLFVDGPGLHAEVSNEELRGMVQSAQNMMELQQAAAQRNDPLAQALASLASDDNGETRERIAQAFLTGFCRIPVAGEQDQNSPTLVLTMGNNDPAGQPGQQQNVPLLTQDGAIICFTSEEAMAIWDTEARAALALPGPVIAQASSQAGLKTILINLGSPDGLTLELGPDTVFVQK